MHTCECVGSKLTTQQINFDLAQKRCRVISMHAQNIVGMRLMSECYGIKASEIMGRHRKYPFSLKKKNLFLWLSDGCGGVVLLSLFYI